MRVAAKANPVIPYPMIPMSTMTTIEPAMIVVRSPAEIPERVDAGAGGGGITLAEDTLRRD
jgi:hypothetical protein